MSSKGNTERHGKNRLEGKCRDVEKVRANYLNNVHFTEAREGTL